MEKKQKDRILIKSYFDDVYLEKNGIIVDEFCPECKRALLESKKFCECGFNLKAKKNTKKWVSFFVFVLFVFPVATFLIFNYAFIKEPPTGVVQVKNSSLESLTPLNIQLISALNGTPYRKYVQNIYADVKDENKLYILIRPSFWHIVNDDDKKRIMQTVSQKWNILYSVKYPDSNKKPIVVFANAE